MTTSSDASGTHAQLSPSSAHRWMNCPGSVELIDRLTKAGEIDPHASNEYADEGTFAHTMAEHCLKKNLQAESVIGVVSECGRFTVDEEFAGHVQSYLDAVRVTMQLYRTDGISIERRVHAIKDVVHGTADAIIWAAPCLHVFDLKFGSGRYVEVEGNVQALIYALGALLSNPKKALAIERIYIHIVQPRHSADPKWRTATTTKAALLSWLEHTLRPAVRGVENGTGVFVPGEKQCQWCEAKAFCPSLREQSLARTQQAFAEVSPATLAPDQIGELLDKFPLIEGFMSAVRAHAYTMVKANPSAVPGYKLVHKKCHRKWKDEERARKKLTALGIDPHTEPKLISPAQAEKKLGAKKKAVVGELAVTPLGDTVLARDDDPRKVALPGSKFSVVE